MAARIGGVARPGEVGAVLTEPEEVVPRHLGDQGYYDDQEHGGDRGRPRP